MEQRDRKDRRQARIDRWQARIEEVGRAQSRYLALLLAMVLFYMGLLVSDANRTGPQEVFGLKLPLPLLYALGPFALCFSILGVYGTMRMATHAKLRLRVLGAYVPSPFMDIPNFLDAMVFTPRPPWGRRIEREIGRVLYPLVLTFPMAEAALLFVIGGRQGYIPDSSRFAWWVLPVYGLTYLWAGGAVWRMWRDRYCKKKRNQRRSDPTRDHDHQNQ